MVGHVDITSGANKKCYTIIDILMILIDDTNQNKTIDER
jgi:hypothetical protein